MKKISVVITTCNRNILLNNLIDALQTQNNSVAEIVIVDNSFHRLARTVYKAHTTDLIPLVYIHNNKNSAPRARNLGLKKVSSEIVAFLDDDCLPEPKWAYTILQFFRKTSDRKILLMGKNRNGHMNSAISAAEYYLTEITYQCNYIKTHREVHSLALDSKNFAVNKTSIIRDAIFFDERFSEYTSFEDIDYGIQARQKNYVIIFLEKMRASHLGRVTFLSFIKREITKTKGLAVFKKKWGYENPEIKEHHRFAFNSGKLKNEEKIKHELKKELLTNKNIPFKITFHSMVLISHIIRIIWSWQ